MRRLFRRFKRNKGFSLIELLAVVVIIGILAVLAYIGISRAVLNSRKEVLITYADAYVKEAKNSVNELRFNVSKDGKIYAISFDCFELENDESEVLGSWKDIGDEKQFGYVLVQYDKTKKKYVYGFTFQTSAGYYVTPITMDNIDLKDIKADNSLIKPDSDEYYYFVDKKHWDRSFNLDEENRIIVIDKDKFGTCIVDENSSENVVKRHYKTSKILYWNINKINEVFTISDKDISDLGTWGGSFTNYSFEKHGTPWYNYYTYVKHIKIEGEVVPDSMDYWFDFPYLYTADFSGLHTNNVTSMKGTFSGSGTSPGLDKWTKDITIDFSGWDTSNVTNMDLMFSNAFKGLTVGNINIDLSGFDVSKVTSMKSMFSYAFQGAKGLDLGDLSKWDMSSVKTTYYMFSNFAEEAKTINMGDISHWNFLNNTTMAGMFSQSMNGVATQPFYITYWNTPKLENMSNTFRNMFGSVDFFVLDFSHWNTPCLNDLSETFGESGYNSYSYYVNFANLDVSNVVYFNGTMDHAGYNANKFNVVGLENWQLDSCTLLQYFFDHAGYNATEWSISDLSKWDTSKVYNIRYMFYGYNGKSTKPVNLDLSMWDMGNVQLLEYTFAEAGRNSSSVNINIGNWNNKITQDLSYMFYKIGKSSTNSVCTINMNNTQFSSSSFKYSFSKACSTGTLNLDLSKYDFKNAFDLTNMFSGNYKEFNVYIPKTTLSKTNTSKILYGSGSTKYSILSNYNYSFKFK